MLGEPRYENQCLHLNRGRRYVSDEVGREAAEQAMKVTLLGTGTPVPDVRRASSSVLVELSTEVLVFDCGPGTFARFIQAGIRPTQLTTIAITHYHYDHYTELADFVLPHWEQGGGLIPELTIYGPRPIAEIVEAFFGPKGAFAPDQAARTQDPISISMFEARGGINPRRWVDPTVVEVSHGSRIEGSGWMLRAIEVPHSQPYLRTLAYRLDCEEGSIVYAGDGGPSEQMVELAGDADVLIHECSALTGDETFTPEEREAIERESGSHKKLAALAERARVKTLVLTHLTQQLDVAGVREKLVHEVSQRYSGRVILGADLLEISPDSFEEQPWFGKTFAEWTTA
jgi:ribonuclease Z